MKNKEEQEIDDTIDIDFLLKEEENREANYVTSKEFQRNNNSTRKKIELTPA